MSSPGDGRPRRSFDNLGRFLVRGTLGTLMLQGLTVVLSLGTSVVMARLLGAGGFGAYAYALTWANLLTALATLGLGQVVAREVAVALSEGRWSTIRSLSGFSARATLAAAVVVMGATGVGIWLATGHLEASLIGPLVVSVPLIFLNSQTWMLRFRLIGLRRVVLAQWAESVVRPGVFLLAVAALWFGIEGVLDPRAAMGMQVFAAGVALVGMGMMARRVTPAEVASASLEPPQTSAWMRSAFPLLFLMLANTVSSEASVLVMGSMLEEADVGVFRMAERLTLLLSYTLLALNRAFSPVAASLYAENDLRRLEVTSIRVARIALLVSLPLYIGLVLFGESILDLVSTDFGGGSELLWILGLGQLANVTAGPVGVVLVMSRHESDTAWALCVTALTTVLLNLVGIHYFGVVGAAWATAAGQLLWNSLLLVAVYRRLGLVVGALSWRWLRP